MADAAAAPRKVRLFLATERKDRWWLEPLLTLSILLTFIVYANWAAYQGEHYYYGPYLSPFYSPELFGNSPHAWFGPPPGWWPTSILPYSAAWLILIFPLGFRLTCYYYRGAYYKAFWADPVACAVGEPRKHYLGERHFPLLIQNIHRYFLYAALVFIVMLTYDVVISFRWSDGFHVGLGSIVMAVNVTLISAYTFGCHSLRHLVGGRKDSLPKGPIGKNCYDCVSGLNRRHMLFAWCSLTSVGFTDLYIRMCSMGVWSDLRIF